MTHPLKRYIDTTGIPQSELARAVGISRGYMSELVGGTKSPSLEIAFAMQAATGGYVPASSWVSRTCADSGNAIAAPLTNNGTRRAKLQRNEVARHG